MSQTTQGAVNPAPTEQNNPVIAATQAIADYVALSYEYITTIEIAKRRIAKAKQQITTALRDIDPTLSDADRRKIFSDFYWDAMEISKEPVMDGLGIKSIQQIGILQKPTGIACLGCGDEIMARSRTHYLRLAHYVNAWDYCVICNQISHEDEITLQYERGDEQDQRWATLRSMPYADYLQSPEWRQTRTAALKRARYRCQLCGAEGLTLDVHHSTYERRGHELPSDVIVLCRPCHTRHHTELPESDLNQPGAQS